MFSALGLFKNTSCPRQHDCSLPSCIFSHSPPALPPGAGDALQTAKEYDPSSAGDYSPPPAKRRRLASPQLRKGKEDDGPKSLSSSENQNLPHGRSTGEIKVASAKNATGPTQSPLSTARTPARTPAKVTPASVTRAVSPPPLKEKKALAAQGLKNPPKAESLTPRTVARAPAVFKTRLAVLQGLHGQMHLQNQGLATMNDERKALVLSRQEIITFALDEEEAATKLGENIYHNTMSQKVLRIKKMTTEEWLKAVGDWTGATNPNRPSRKPLGDTPQEHLTGLSSLTEQVAVLKKLQTPLDGLEEFGYVTSKPTDQEIASAKAGVAAAGGFETCDRCGTRFQVFPGRDGDGRLTSNGKCHYHWGKPNRTSRPRTDRILGQSEAIYPCCNKPEGSEGCSEAASHVFGVKDPKRLASIFQFEHTPANPDVRGGRPLTFDCEMGYTTLGMEVIRVTAVSWPEGKPVVDVLVRPYGEILDLNTRFSGVTKEAYANAPSYESDLGDQSAFGATPEEALPLRKVESPAAARQLLFAHMTPDTPLIGHAIDNDLNVCRIIHPCVVDTILLYAHPRGLPFRYGLKMLSQKYLSRSIQTGGEAGHDSKEDAIATGDLVTRKIAEKWSIMQHEGWKFAGGVLTAPEGMEKKKKSDYVSML